jgi:amino acid adenylation domain-containing protein
MTYFCDSKGLRPLSLSEGRIVLLESIQPGTPQNNVLAAWHLRGSLDLDRLRHAMEQVSLRHEVLRSTYRFLVEPSVRLVEVHARVPLRIVTGEGRAAIADAAARPIDLTQQTYEVTLVHTGPQAWTLLLNLHHVISDGNHSAALWMREVVSFYEGNESTLPDLFVGPDQMARRQLEHRKTDAYAHALLDYVEAMLDVPPMLRLPCRRSTSPQHDCAGAAVSISIDETLTERLRDLAGEQYSSLEATVLAAFGAMLFLESREEAFAIAVPLPGREVNGSEHLIGYFGNPVAMPFHLNGAECFSELIRAAQKSLDEACRRSALSFDDLVWELDPPRSLGVTPVFQVLFEARPALPTHQSGEVIFEPMDLQEGILAPYDIVLGFSDRRNHAWAQLEYAIGAFDAHDIARFAGLITRILQIGSEFPDLSLDRLPLLTDAEAVALKGFTTGAALDKPLVLPHLLFERRVDATPHRTALVLGDKTLSYAELDLSANRLAHYLKAQGVGPDGVVALCLPRGIDAVVSVLAVMKAGACFAALDPTYPTDRLRLTLLDCGAKVLIAPQNLIEAIDLNVQGFCPRAKADEIAASQSVRLPSPLPEHLNYLIYTSGTTGLPKAIAMPYLCLANLVTWQRSQPLLGQPRTTLQFAALNFDIGYQELFTTWDSGAKVVLLPEEVRRDPHLLLVYLQEHRIERLYLPFVALENLALAARGTEIQELALSEVITAGEQLRVTPPIVELFERLPQAVLYNQYGPSEAHVVTSLRLEGPPSGWPALPGIGRPVGGLRIQLLNDALSPVPLGAPGEVCVSGPQIARGYLNRPALTARSFVPDPFVPGERMYRTGDLARLQQDGTLQFLGRVDDQVKVRGFRVEPGETAHVLGEVSGVAQAFAAVDDGAEGDGRLVGWIVPEPGVSAEALLGSVEVHLHRRLPEYMRPSALRIVPEIPLLVTGKVNRRALSTLSSLFDDERRGPPPRTATEIAVAQLWSEFLDVSDVGIDDNFFGLGGHSLLATRVVSAVRANLGVEVRVADVFSAPTLEAFCAVVDTEAGQGLASRPPVRPLPTGTPSRLSFAQRRIWFMDQINPGNPAFNVPRALELVGEVDLERLERALQAVVQRHVTLRSAVSMFDGEPVLVEVADPHVPIANLGKAKSLSDALGIAKQFASGQFDLATQAPLRVGCVTLDGKRRLIVVVIHHLVSDDWSETVFFADWAHAFKADAALPALVVGYPDYSAWQRDWMSGGVIESHLAYWRERLAGAPAVLRFPSDELRPAIHSYEGALERFTLDRSLSERVRQRCLAQGVTPFMGLLCGFFVLLTRHTGAEDLVLGTPVANRAALETEGLVGLMVNTLVLRVDSSGNPTFWDLLERVREASLGAFEHQDLPFELLVEALKPDRSLAYHPLVQVMFSFHNAPKIEFKLPYIDIVEHPLEHTDAKFDLVLSIEDESVLRGHFEYASNLITQRRVRRFVVHYRRILTALADHPHDRIWDIEILSPEERQELLALAAPDGAARAS